MNIAVPKARPKLGREEIEVHLHRHGVAVKDKVVLFAQRGYYKRTIGNPNKNDVNVYDDMLAVVTPERVVTFNANTDPAKLGTGLAMLKAGVYRFYKGKHKSKYNALRAFPEGVKLPAIRDGVSSTCQYINIHLGGYANTYSAGCLTVYPKQWDEFIKFVYREMTKYEQDTITLLLIG